MHIQGSNGRKFIGRLEKGDDLLKKLTTFCKTNQIRLGHFSLIGAVQQARLGYYNQKKQAYEASIPFDQTLEIASGLGNISQKDDDVMVHCHLVLTDYEGKAYGGHLCPETIVFAAEFVIQEVLGDDLVRGIDINTGLPLWVE